MAQVYPEYSKAERVADGCIHILGVTASVVAASILIAIAIHHLPSHATASVLVYSAGLLAVFCCSAAYNMSGTSAWKSILRRFDHAAIYVKIAATYTPFAVVKLTGVVGFALLGTVWAVAVIGVIAKLALPGQFVRTAYVLYLAQGWAAVATINPLLSALSSTALILLGVGGVLYTVGVAFHLWHTLRYHNAIWHGFVLVASACHFAAVVDALVI